MIHHIKKTLRKPRNQSPLLKLCTSKYSIEKSQRQHKKSSRKAKKRSCEFSKFCRAIIELLLWMWNNPVAAVFNMLATSRSYGNIRCCNKNYRPDKITLKLSVLRMEYLLAEIYKLWMVYFFGFNCYWSRNRDTEKWYTWVVKGTVI